MKKASELFGKVDIELLEKAEIQNKINKINKIQKEIDKLGIVSTLELGWQTQRFAKKSRKLDMLCQEKFELQKLLE